MGELNSHQIARIILKMRYETATEEEKRVLEAWMKSWKGRQTIYDRIVSDESLKEYRDLKAEFDGGDGLRKIAVWYIGNLGETGLGRENFNESPGGGGSVAAVLLVVCLFVYKYAGEPLRKRWERCGSAKNRVRADHSG